MQPETPLALRDIKPLAPVPLGTPWYVWAAVVLGTAALLAVAWWWWWRRRRRAASLPPAPPEPADVVALRALSLAYAAERSGAALRRSYYFKLSEIVRAYLEARFGVNATDLTTEEIARMPRLSPEMAISERERLLTLLGAADAVKFAKRDPSDEDCARDYEQARALVLATRPAQLGTTESAA